jgi:hypothetical protein
LDYHNLVADPVERTCRDPSCCASSTCRSEALPWP